VKFWPLRSPPQIAGDSATVSLSTSYANVDLPVCADGEPARYVLLAWEGGEGLQVKMPGNSLAPWFHELGMPYLLRLSRTSATRVTMKLRSGTGTLHLTPVEGR